MNEKKPDILKKLRQIIQEEVRAAIKAELTPVLLEVVKAQAGNRAPAPVYENTTPVQQVQPVASKPPSQHLQSYIQSLLPKNTPASSLLEETYREMVAGGDIVDPQLQEALGINTAPVDTPVGSVTDMLRTASKSTREEAVEVSVVPDFREIMKRIQ